MNIATVINVILNVLTIAFLFGGFVMVTKNHFRHLDEDVAWMKRAIAQMQKDIAFIKGRCIMHIEMLNKTESKHD